MLRTASSGARVYVRTADALLVTDGAAAGTRTLTAHAPVGDGRDASLAVIGDRVFFVVSDGSRDGQLWASDGTAEGTAAVEAPWARRTRVHEVLAHGTRVYFNGDCDARGRQLMSTDGCDLETTVPNWPVHEKDLNPRSLVSMPTGIVFVAAQDAATSKTRLVSFVRITRRRGRGENCEGCGDPERRRSRCWRERRRRRFGDLVRGGPGADRCSSSPRGALLAIATARSSPSPPEAR